jgi:hypothetical protein
MFGYQVAFKDSIAGQTLKRIMLHDPIRAALFRKVDASLDNWAEQIVSEEPARPSQMAIWVLKPAGPPGSDEVSTNIVIGSSGSLNRVLKFSDRLPSQSR